MICKHCGEEIIKCTADKSSLRKCLFKGFVHITSQLHTCDSKDLPTYSPKHAEPKEEQL